MNQVTTQQKLGSQVAMTNSEGGFAVTPQTLNDIVEFAKFMCQSNAGIPAFLRNNAPDCAAVTMQAMKWGFDPFSVAQKSYKVKDIIAYEAQLIAAVVNARSGIKGRLRYQFEGTGDDLVCTVTGTLDGEEYSYTSPRSGNITTKNSPLWKTDPQQQLGYYSSRNWARRYCPEVLLGVYDREEAEEFRGPDRAKDITSQVIEDPLSDEPFIRPQLAQDERACLGAVDGAGTPHDALTGEIIEPQNAGEDIPAPSADDAASATAASEGETAQPQNAVSPSTNPWLLNIARMLWAATNYNGDVSVLKAQKQAAVASYPKPDDCPAIISGKAESVYAYCKQITEGSLEPDDGLAIIAGVVGCDQDDLKLKGE